MPWCTMPPSASIVAGSGTSSPKFLQVHGGYWISPQALASLPEHWRSGFPRRKLWVWSCVKNILRWPERSPFAIRRSIWAAPKTFLVTRRSIVSSHPTSRSTPICLVWPPLRLHGSRRGAPFWHTTSLCPPHPLLRRVWRLYFYLLQTLGAPLLPAWREIFYGLPRLIQETRWVHELPAAMEQEGFHNIRLDYLTLSGSALLRATAPSLANEPPGARARGGSRQG